MEKNTKKKPDWSKRRRKHIKKRMIEALGGRCCICGYSRCHASLAFHHLKPAEKKFKLGGIRPSPDMWPVIVAELKKCILVCHNCHMEIHAGLIEIDDLLSFFRPEYEDVDFVMSDEIPKMRMQRPVILRALSTLE